MEKKFVCLGIFFLIISLSVNIFSQKNEGNFPIFSISNQSENNEQKTLLKFVDKKDLNTIEINKLLKQIAESRDTLSYLTALALIQKNYLITDVSSLSQINEFLDLGPYYSSMEYSFYLWMKTYRNLFYLVFGFLLLSGILFYWKSKAVFPLVLSLFSVFGLLFIQNYYSLFPEKKQMIYDAKMDLMDNPSFLASNLKDKIRKGEMLTLVGESELWYEVKFENTTYFVPRNQRPFLF